MSLNILKFYKIKAVLTSATGFDEENYQPADGITHLKLDIEDDDEY
jgi:hypothetical protein